MNRLRTVIDSALGWLLALLMGLAVANVTWQVASRYLGPHAGLKPSSYTEELARYLLIWIGLLGSAYATGRGMHLSLDLLPQALTDRGKRRLSRLIAACVLLFAVAIMIWGGSRLVWMTFYLQQKSAAMRVPLGYVYLAVPVSGVLMGFYALAQLAGGGTAPSDTKAGS